MALSLIDKLTNYLMPVEELENQEQLVSEVDNTRGRKSANLSVHTNELIGLKVLIALPTKYDDACIYADCLKENMAVIVNFATVDMDVCNAIKDFMNGVCYVIDGNVQRISDFAFVYAPSNVNIDKELYAYSVPAYVKPKNE